MSDIHAVRVLVVFHPGVDPVRVIEKIEQNFSCSVKKTGEEVDGTVHFSLVFESTRDENLIKRQLEAWGSRERLIQSVELGSGRRS